MPTELTVTRTDTDNRLRVSGCAPTALPGAVAWRSSYSSLCMTSIDHVFIQRGGIENLDCDAFVLPTDDAPSGEPMCKAALGHPSTDEPRSV